MGHVKDERGLPEKGRGFAGEAVFHGRGDVSRRAPGEGA